MSRPRLPHRAHGKREPNNKRGGTADYGLEFGLDEYRRMAELARTIKGRMVISVGDCREMREAFKGLSISEVAINYTIGKTAPKKAVELIIKNW